MRCVEHSLIQLSAELVAAVGDAPTPLELVEEPLDQ
jgi:hypothetical protein